MGGIRVVLNSSNQVVSANDYDAWGYPLENRSYQPENSKYKFTGKERDRDLESNYDYFGARYYDSRIGRWGGVEPLLDKYVNISPYCYSVCNPIIAKDVNGRDAKVTINNDIKTITFEMTFSYISAENNDVYGLDNDQISALKTFETDIEDYWSTISVEMNGEMYSVETQVNLIATNSLQELNAIGNTEGNNFALNQTGNVNVGIGEEFTGAGIVGNILYLNRGSDLKIDKYTGPHEAGHLFGLPDRGYGGNSIMHWRKSKDQIMDRPSEADVKGIFNYTRNKGVDFNSSKAQSIRSYNDKIK